MRAEGKSRARWAGSLSLWAGGLAIISMPVSISLAQGLYGVAFLSLLVDRSVSDSPRWPLALRRVYLLVFLLYGSWVFSSVCHSIIETSADPLMALLRSDVKDVLLAGMGLWAFHHAEQSDARRRTVYRFVALGFLVALLSGLIAVFSPYRLSRILYHMQHGWQFSADARLQHPMFHVPLGFASIALHMPVGFLGTHLAYGAQLGLFFVPLALFSMDRILRQGSLRGLTCFDMLILFLTLLAACVLFLNNARSALFGIISALLGGVIILTGRSWKKRAWILVLPPLLAVSLVGGGLALTGGKGFLREFLMQSVGLEQKHSDYQRVMLWSTVAEVVKEHALIGTGPGRFSDAILDAMNERAGEDRPYLWYLYMQTERGHSHNDFLHQLAMAGVPAATIYMLLWFLILRTAFGGRSSALAGPGRQEVGRVVAVSPSELERKSASSLLPADLADQFREFIPYAPIVLFFGGVFQCYFLDDQVMLPFWLMLGLAFQAREGQPTRG